ncbi:MAG: hypothetical protein ACREIT_04255 [Tepidisphaeraceae bacterium]
MFVHWDPGSAEHIAKHGVTMEEAEYVVSPARVPFPERVGGDKFAVWGATERGRFLQVIFAYTCRDGKLG